MLKSTLHGMLFAALIGIASQGFAADVVLNLATKSGKLQDVSDNKLKIRYTAGVTPVKVKELATLQLSSKNSIYIGNKQSQQFLSMGTDSMTLSAMVKITGTKGAAYVMSNGAGNYLSPGYRFGARVADGKINFYVLLVGKPFGKKKYNYVQVNTAKGKRPASGSWLYVTAVINRDKDVIIYVNDEIVGQGSVTKLAQQDLGNKYFSIPVSSRN
ncbi:MAG: LamG domain-containing protein, partial [Victivallaceae bacterium]|nr:LamG domain-containing protein [Victivallaceae bacterium]